MIGAPAVLAERLELLANLRVVVDLAVERDGDGAGIVHHRLRRVGREIDDGEPPVAERAAAIRSAPESHPVRTAMRHPVAHPRDDGRISRGPGRIECSDDAAHVPYESRETATLSGSSGSRRTWLRMTSSTR